MRLNVIILLSLIGHSFAEKLQVKCGDELCEKPSNRAVTTLRYTPDKPYKLQINAVNSEVEIFGATDDLFYIRYGKNYGFLPKNHLREKARGNFLHPVEIDFSSLHINQEAREKNFLHEFIKSSQSETTTKNIIDNSNETKENVKQSEEVKMEKPSSIESEERPKDYIPIGTEPKIVQKNEDIQKVNESSEVKTSEKIEKEVEANDSGIEDDDEEEDEEGEEDDDEEGEDDENEVLDKIEAKNETSSDTQQQQPELVVIPVTKDVVEEVKIDVPEVKPASIDIDSDNSTLPQEIVIESDTNKNAPNTLPSPPTELIKEQEQPKKVEPIETLENKNVQSIENQQQKVVEEKKYLEEQIAVETIISEKNETQHPILEEKVEIEKAENIQQNKEVIKSDAIVKKEIKEPAPVTENANEDHYHHHEHDHTTNKPEEKIEAKTEDHHHHAHDHTTSKPEEKIEDHHDHNHTTNKSEEKIEDHHHHHEHDHTTNKPEEKIETKTEDHHHEHDHITNKPEEKIEIEAIPVKSNEPDITAEVVEKIEMETVTASPEITHVPDISTTSDSPNIQQEPETTIPPPPQKKEKPKFDQDMLLKRFDEKLGYKNPEGVGSVEQIHKDHHHHHDEPHHHHEHDKNIDNTKQLPVVNNLEEEKPPGFFGNVMKSIFGDEKKHENHEDEKITRSNSVDEGFCEKIDSENCPKSFKSKVVEAKHESKWKTMDEYVKIMLNEAIEVMDVIISMSLVAVTVLIFIFGYYCISKAKKEGPLIAKMNELERHLMASMKENEMLKGDVIATKQKLLSIEDNSFGSNDMVIALKNELEASEQEKNDLSEKIASLEKELEAAAEDGLELNRMVSELLNNQTGSDSIISSVEDLQRQLNEQQETIITMNETLAAKSRENTELQIQLTEINGKCSSEIEKFQQQLDAVALERSNLQIELENLKRESDTQVNQIIEERNSEVTRLNKELTSYAGKYDEAKKLLNTTEAKVQALEECIETVRKNKGVGSADLKGLLDVADLKADLLAVTKEKSTMQEQLQTERDSRKLLDDRVKSISEEMNSLKKEFGIAEKEKLEAQTRLEVLSTYFKDKETQLQQELSVKEARWMKQQGETTSTVEKIQALNDEIQTLKSQNDSLRAEIEAQVAAHKLNISSIEAQAHSAWLNARQAERKLEESRMESAALRRRLTSIAENPSGIGDILNGLPGTTNDSMNSLPSPIRVESPNNSNHNPLPPPPMMMPPFLPGAPPNLPFLPPFLPPPPHGEMPMGLPPLGRLMSPPPKRFTPTMRDERDRYSPRGRRYSPDSRYDDDYTAFETETDYSPPPSPPPPRRGYNSPTDRNSKKSKGNGSTRWSESSSSTSSTYTDDELDDW